VILEIADTQHTRLAPYLRRHLLAAHKLLRPALSELSIALVNTQTIARLHGQFMQVSRPTDVLTFELGRDASQCVTAGEIVICVPYARRMAKANNVPLRAELLLYCLHGMLHLCGYDDKMQRGFSRMHRKEDEILTQLGVGPVFKTGVVDAARVKTGSKGTIR